VVHTFGGKGQALRGKDNGTEHCTSVSRQVDPVSEIEVVGVVGNPNTIYSDSGALSTDARDKREPVQRTLAEESQATTRNTAAVTLVIKMVLALLQVGVDR
jgi:hypothetical protein